MTATRFDLSSLGIDSDVTEFARAHNLQPVTGTFSGYWDNYQPPIVRRAAPIVLKLRPGKAFRAHSRLVTEFRDGGATTTVDLSPADDARLHRYLHPEVYARRSAMHSAYRRRRR
jgi:hypothetical protein